MNISLKLLFPLFMLIAMGVATHNAVAQISVDQVVHHIKAGDRPIRNLIVRNTGDEALNLQVLTDVMVRPGFPDQERTSTDDLLASPKRFSIPAGGQRTVRIVVKKVHQDKEQVFRLAFEPDLKRPEPSGPGPTIKVITTIGVLILVEPRVVKKELVWTRSGNKIVFDNIGTVNALLEDGKHCPFELKEGDGGIDSSKEQLCTRIKTNRLYPGNSWEITVPSSHYLSFRRGFNDDYQMLIIAPTAMEE